MNELPVRLGDVLAGKYRVESVLGSGGMGVVVAAVHVELNQRVALKFLLPHALESGEAASRFLREARAAVKIDSEHVARVLDVGRLENGAPYMVMEYLEGTDLSLHPRGADLAIDDAIDFVLQACAAMAVAHAAGIVHRDLKPANLFVTKRPDGSNLLKVLDFGISKMSVLEASANLTNSQAIMGSPLYMSPEQGQSARNVDARTDIWSLGVILYELLTGDAPFPGESLGEVLSAVITLTPKSIRAVRPEVPEALEKAVLRALEKPVERRFQNIGELSAALVEFAPVRSQVLHDRVSGVMSRAGLSSVPPPPSMPPRASSIPVARDPAPAISATDTNWVGQPKARKNRLKVPLLIGASAVSAMLIAGVWLTLRGAESAARSAQAPSARSVAATTDPPSAPSRAEPALVQPVPATAPIAPVETQTTASASAPSAPRSKPTYSAPRAASAAAPAFTSAPALSAVPAPTAAPARKKSPLSIDFK
ncbi:MAG TPA: protein kinase [Polyangiaceae bacterium]|nr:protein kinase [Polyangiaceae bacterium]